MRGKGRRGEDNNIGRQKREPKRKRGEDTSLGWRDT